MADKQELLRCPTCQELMRKVNFGDIELDECRFCDGLWLDRDEPEALSAFDVIGKHMLQPIVFDDSRKTVPEGERRCPRCEVVMQTVSHRDVTVDVCPECRGMWLDRWELQGLIKE